jgi:Uma2 family endonuclease
LILAISESWELVPDMVGFLGPKPEPYPTEPVSAVIEVLSPGNYLRLHDKCQKYAEWGVSDIVVFDPLSRRSRSRDA